MNKNSPLPFEIKIVAAFFLSGSFGLMYEVLWTRYLADLLGATSLSQLVVLMVFMGGLSLGALLFGRIIDHQYERGLFYFGGLELFIGLYAVAFPMIFPWFGDTYLSLARNFALGSAPLFLLKITAASLLIILPAMAMGGTLPAVTRYLTRSQQNLRINISMLYGVNNLGAVAGVLLGGFYLVQTYGMNRSMVYVGLGNIILGISLLAIAWYSKSKTKADLAGDGASARRLADNLEAKIYQPYAARRAVIAAGISSFAAMALQVALIRYFVIVLGATHSSFTIVVAAFIFGIGLGSLLVTSRAVGRIPLPTLLTSLFALTASVMAISLFIYGRVPFEISRILSIFVRSPLSWPVYEFFRFGICFVIMLLPTLASGMILPICVRIAGRSQDRIGRDVARVYAVSSIGALLGILAANQLLFRVFSLPRTLQIIMFVYMFAAIALAFVLKEKGRKRIFALIAIVGLTHLSFWRPWPADNLFVDRLNFGDGPQFEYSDFIKNNKNGVIVEERQGSNVQVVVKRVKNKSSQNDFQTMYINGKPDASDDPLGSDWVTEIMLAQLPMLLHPMPTNVFVLGLGSGITSGEALKNPRVNKVVTAELAGEVFEASKNFAAANSRFWENPKHRMVIEDGKNFLALTPEKFDVIAMEPTNIWQEGMAGLFSEDFFRLVKARLADGGIVAQWLHTYKIDDLTLNIVLKTFAQVFPQASVFSMGGGDILIVGYEENWKFDPLKAEHDFYRPGIRESMTKGFNLSLIDLLLREVLSRESFRSYTEGLDVPVNTVNFPILEKVAEYGYFMKQPAYILRALDSRVDLDNNDLLLQRYIERLRPVSKDWQPLLESKIVAPNPRLLNSLIFKMLEEGPTGERFDQLIALISDQVSREIVLHPNYGRNPDEMGPDELYQMVGGELMIWARASSLIWKPSINRLQMLYSNLAVGVDPLQDGFLAMSIAIGLGENGACGPALPFFRRAEVLGAMSADNMRIKDVYTAFHCEVKTGDPQKALNWWKVIEANDSDLFDQLLHDKTTLDIKLGGEPPPVYYGRKSH